MNAGEREDLRDIIDAHFYDTGWRCSCGWVGTADRWSAHVETAVLDWLRARLASDEVREVVAEALLTEHMDGDFLVAVGRSIGSEGSDVPISDARPSEVAWWATDAALTAVLAALEVER